MSYSALYVGLTGLKAHSAILGNIGNNLANVNTIGFKGSRASFADVFSSASLAINEAGQAQQIGLGTQLASVQQLFNQGALQPTEVATDLAISGNGLFVLRDNQGTQLFSRAGNFSFNSEGTLVTQTGLSVQGFTQTDANGNIVSSGAINDIQIPVGLTAPPRATSFFTATINLDAESIAEDIATPGVPVPDTFATSVGVFDSLGAEHQATLLFTPQDTNADGAPDQWSWSMRVPDTETTQGPAAGDPPGTVTIASGVFTFTNGQLDAPADIPITFPAWTNGAAGQTVDWQVLDSSGNATVQSFAASSSLDGLDFDGFTLGRIRALTVSEEGVMSGVFTNGETLQLAQIAIGTVNNPSGLLRFGDNVFATSIGSGPVAIGAANTGARGAITARALELSNIDLTDQLTNLIVAERGYQANSRIITTTDTVIQEALSIKR